MTLIYTLLSHQSLGRSQPVTWGSMPCELRAILRCFLEVVPALQTAGRNWIKDFIDVYGWEHLASKSPKHRLYSKNNVIDAAP